MFQLTKEEVASLISQNAMSKQGRGGRRTLPYAFTEHGAVMAANILKSPLLTPPQNPPIKPKKKIGFEVKEPKGRYGKRTRKKHS